jgi:hypothetical protein
MTDIFQVQRCPKLTSSRLYLEDGTLIENGPGGEARAIAESKRREGKETARLMAIIMPIAAIGVTVFMYLVIQNSKARAADIIQNEQQNQR